MCEECYSNCSRITPLLEPRACLSKHTQYICKTCGRCICVEADEKRGLRRWNFPFKSMDIAKLYLRAAEVTTKGKCGIYEIKSEKGRISYKIFESEMALKEYLNRNKGKTCETMQAVYTTNTYKVFEDSQIRRLNDKEIEDYLKGQNT